MDTVPVVFGVILWIIFTAIPVLYLLVTLFRFNWSRKPALWLPMQGSRAAQGQSEPTLLFPILAHLVSLGGAAVAIVLHPFTNIEVKAGTYDSYGASNATESLVLRDSIVVSAVFLILWAALSLYHLLLMICHKSCPLLWWNNQPELRLPKMWAAQGFLLTLVFSGVSVLGFVFCLCGGGNPNTAYYMLVISVVFSALQQFLLKRHIEATPWPLPASAPVHPHAAQVFVWGPAPGVAQWAAPAAAPQVASGPARSPQGYPVYAVEAFRSPNSGEPQPDPETILPPRQLPPSQVAQWAAPAAASGPASSPQGYPVYAVEAIRSPDSGEPQPDPETILPPRQLPRSQVPPSQLSAVIHSVPAVMEVRPSNELELQQQILLPSMVESHNDG